MTARLRHRVDSSTQVERETDYSCYVRKTRDVSVATTPPNAWLDWRPKWSGSKQQIWCYVCATWGTNWKIITVFKQVSNIWYPPMQVKYACEILTESMAWFMNSFLWTMTDRWSVKKACLENKKNIKLVIPFVTTKIKHKVIWLREIHTNEYFFNPHYEY